MLLKLPLRLIQFVLQYRRAKILWSSPPKAKIAILDAPTARLLTPICGAERFEAIHIRGEQLHITFGILWATAIWTLKTKQPLVGYVIALLEQIQPVITITFVDNARLFYEVSRRYGGSRFLAIQNAARYDTNHLSPALAREIHIPEFACFGEFEKNLYLKKGATVGKFYPIGSLNDAYYRERHASRHKVKEYDVCVVAEPAPGWDELEGPGFEDAIGNIAKYAVEFCKKHEKRLCIAGKRDPGAVRDSEQLWYEKYIGTEVEIIPRVREEFTTYGLVDRSAVSIAFISSALQEGMGRGNRVLFCNFTGDQLWSFPIDGIWRLNDATYEAFERRMLELLEMSDAEFQRLSSPIKSQVMNYDEKNPTHIFLKKLIAEAVER